ncbi:MAG: imelysin family protein [Burkholderiaceae bacterium]
MHSSRPGRSSCRLAVFALAFAGVLIAGCTEKGPGAAEVATTDARIAHAVYEDSLETARRLRTVVEDFLADPSEANYTAARQAWLDAREPYGQSEVYRFRLSPIDSTNGVDEDGPEGRINAWPLGEALIDYVAERVDGDAGPEAGTPSVSPSIIADRERVPRIDKAAIAALDQDGGDERNVATGYHAIEFLLWGQDLNEGEAETGWDGIARRDATPGQRPRSDYDTAGGCTSGVGSPQPDIICQRRGDYLRAATELLVDDLAGIVARWDPEDGDYHRHYVASGDVAVAKMLESMGRLGYGELAGERIQIPLILDSQEDEHSCFSDNTHRDIYLNALGIRNSFDGSYRRIDGSLIEGTGLDGLLRARGHVAIADELGRRIDVAVAAAEAIVERAEGGMPFDMQIQVGGPNDPVINAMIAALVAQTASVQAAIEALGLKAGDLRQDTEQQL